MSLCLTPTELERLAESDVHQAVDPCDTFAAGDAARAQHVLECATCRAALDEIRANRRFLAEIAEPLRNASVPKAAKADHSFLPGYRRLDVLGHGGQAVVHRAVHEASGRVVAVKVLRFGSVRQRARLAREAQLAATLRHPGIVTVHDCGDLPEGGFAIVMEFVEGAPLDAWSSAVRSGTNTTLLGRRHRIARLFVQICDAVAHAHQNGVIHRDLKPANVLVGKDDQPRVLDFGVAHAAHPGSAAAITRTDEFSGTLAYAAPETLSNSNSPAGTLADVYSIGVMLHEAIVGRPPHHVDGSVETIVRAIVDTDAPRPTSDVDGAAIDADLSVIITKALARDPARRYDSPTALGRDLESWIAGRAIDARRDSVTYLTRVFIRRHRLAVIVTSAVLGLLAGGVVALAILYRHAETARADARLQAAGLANQLFERNIEQALMLVSAERPGPAEALAWREALAPSSPRAVGVGPTDPDFLALLWTLRQVVARNPCIAATIIGSSSAVGLAAHGENGFVVSWSDGTIDRVRSADLGVDWSFRSVWDGRGLGRLVAVDAPTGRVAATPDGRHVVVIDAHGAIQSLRVPIDERPAEDSIRLLAFDGGRLWVLSAQGEALALNADSGEVLRKCRVPAPEGMSGSYFPGNIRAGVLVGAPANTFELVATDLSDGTEIGRFKAAAGWPDTVVAAGLCADGRVLVPNRRDLVLWNPRENKVERLVDLPGILRRVVAPFADRSGTIAVAIFDDGGLRLVNLAQPASTTVLSGHPARISIGAWIAPETLVTAGGGGLVRVWDAQPGRWIVTRSGHRESIGRLSFAADRQTLLSFGREGAIGIWPRDDAFGTADVRALPDDATSLRAAFSPDGTLVALDDRSDHRRIIVRRTNDFTIVAEHVAEGMTGPLDFDRDGTRLAVGLGRTAANELVLGILDVPTRTWNTLNVPGGIGMYTRAIRHSPDGRFLAWAISDGRLFVLGAGASSPPAPLKLRGSARAVAFSPDGDRLVVSHDDGHVEVVDRQSGAVLADTTAHARVVEDVAWAPDGRTFASADSGGEIILWCAKTYRRLASMSLSPTTIQTILFGPESDRLLIGDDIGRVTEWEFDFYDEAIARSLDAWIELLHRDGVETPNAATMRAWASGVER